MKNILSICLAYLLIAGANAQAPEKFSFQGVAKNASGEPVPIGQQYQSAAHDPR